MIAITKEEREKVGAKFPKAHIVRTMKGRSGRHRYYMEESWELINYLRGLRAAPRI